MTYELIVTRRLVVIECIVKYEGGGSGVFFMCSYFQRPSSYLIESVAH